MERPLPAAKSGARGEGPPDGEVTREARQGQSPCVGPTAPSPGCPHFRERPHFSSRRSNAHAASCVGSAYWADSTDTPPRAPIWPIARVFTGRRARGIVTVLRRFREP